MKEDSLESKAIAALRDVLKDVSFVESVEESANRNLLAFAGTGSYGFDCLITKSSYW